MIPESFRNPPLPRDPAWLSALPAALGDRLATWDLRPDGPAEHGSHALVIPVTRAGTPLVLRLNAPSEDVTAHIAALRFWAGRGTVHLVDADPTAGAMLLERLDLHRSAVDLPSEEAMAVLGAMVRRLAVPAPETCPSTADLARSRAEGLRQDWHRQARPFDPALLRAGEEAARPLVTTDSTLAVNGDLHSAQLLPATREPWLTVDPVLLRGDPAYDLARALWTRLDDMPDRTSITEHLTILATAAGIPPDHARDWVVFRATDYYLWGLRNGLTEDPLRCHRLITALT
ncbi:streptomycin 6-kinase [Saccharothrix saharensis]|uniref:Streptomycin 6-kinase n=1 Tax=Saccharothrix saharensis TaxID=571190 RepID=A0A543J8A7_9PSEU|nr:aminoglycoside phosphotransferase family protein [Saccharothrix saharensis]TQM79057.1 streptomycin 6-kinase [Saccharothrix saharensis]